MAWPATGGDTLVPIPDAPEIGMGVPSRENQREIKGKMQAIVSLCLITRSIPGIAGRRCIDLPDADPAVVPVKQLPDAGHEGDRPLAVPGVNMFLEGVNPQEGRVVPEFLIFDHQVDHIEPEPVHPQVEPEFHLFKNGLLNLVIAPVQVGLLPEKRMQIKLLCFFIKGPCASAGSRLPVIWRGSRDPLFPDIPFSFRVCHRRRRRDKPRMPVGGVVEHHVENDPDA